MADRECVEHYTTGREAWKVGFIGVLSRLRGQVLTLVLMLLTMSTPWWWPRSLPLLVIEGRYFIVIVFGGLGILVLSGSLYLRHRAMRSLDVKFYLHDLAHYIRDANAKFAVAPSSPHSPGDERFFEYSRQLTEKIRIYFMRVSGDPNIGVAIRLAVALEGQQEVAYRTIARCGLSANREKTSEDIRQSEGTPRFFLDKGNVGVLIYHDLQSAIKLGAFKQTKSEEKFGDEISSMIVAPLNAAWDDDLIKMIGLLCITSRNKNAFSVRDVDSALFAADTVANSIASVVRTLKGQKRMPPLRMPNNANK